MELSEKLKYLFLDSITTIGNFYKKEELEKLGVPINFIKGKKYDADCYTMPVRKDGKDIFLVAFDSTRSIKDILIDIFCFPKKLSEPLNQKRKDMNVHSGFLLSYMEVRDKIFEAYRESGLQDIWITGFSLGGAYAQLCAYDFFEQYRFDINIEVVFMSSPKIGGKKFVEKYNKRIKNSYGLRYGQDVVTRLPYWYSEVNTIYHFGEPFNKYKIFGNYFKDHIYSLLNIKRILESL